MKRLAQLGSFLALVTTLLSATLFFMNQLPLPVTQAWLLGATIIWFVATPLWMGRKAR